MRLAAMPASANSSERGTVKRGGFTDDESTSGKLLRDRLIVQSVTSDNVRRRAVMGLAYMSEIPAAKSPISTMRALLPILSILFLSLPCHAEGPFTPEKTEKVGPLNLELPASRVQVLFKSKPELGPKELWEADGAYHQAWEYREQGITLDMVSHTKTSSQTINRIVVTSPCRFSTKRGIHIGSTEGEVEQAYGKDLNRDESTKGKALVAGSLYGGLIFGIEKGKVVNITLGAVAE